ncbi:hypothetical protein ACFL6E_02450, partial [Candidatus Neomarinimicrobiota bacterium]
MPLPKGRIKKVEVTKKWFDQMEHEGKFKPVAPPDKSDPPDSLYERAELLLGVAQLTSGEVIAPLLDHYSILQQADVEHSHFILTVAGVFMAASRLNNLQLGDRCEDMLMEVVAERMDQWNPDSIQSFEDCKELYEKVHDRLTEAGHEPRFVASDAVGEWIVRSILKRSPQTDDEIALVRSTGVEVTAAFFHYWSDILRDI